MSFFSKAAGIFFGVGCLGLLALPVLASGTCALSCRVGTAAATPLSSTPSVADERACTALCLPASCPTGATCLPTFTAAPTTTPPPDAPRFVCACGCVNPGGGAPVTVSSAQSCVRALASDPACTTACTTLCRAGTTAPDTRVQANATLAPTNGAGCAVAPPSAASAGDAPAGGATGGSSGGVPPTNAGREAVPLQLSQPIDGVTVVSDFGNYIAVLYRYMIGLAGTAAVVMIVYGGFLYLLGSAMSDVGKGKQIIQDAIIGLLLVLGSYTILSTVSPNTLSLKVPELKIITPVALPENLPPPPPPTTNVCSSPDDPTVGQAFRRYASRGRINVVNGQPCSYDEECRSGTCFMQDQRLGVCSDLSEGSRCRCVGQCCGAMLNPSAPTWLADTNQRGGGTGLCADGMACQQEGDDWKCKRLTSVASGGTLRSGEPVRPTGTEHPSCRLDSECVTALGDPAAACLYNSRLRDSVSGRTECSLGREGDQCQCSGFGCDLSSPPSLRVTGAQVALGNNHGTGRIACQTGLECAPFLRPAGNRADPRDLEYFCQRPATAARCHFTCADGTPAGPQNVPDSCRTADIRTTDGARACLSACENVCGAPGGTNCLGLRCEAVPSTP